MHIHRLPSALVRSMAVLLSSLALVSHSGAVEAQCATELKPTDGYKELSAVLRCLQGEIVALKKATQQPVSVSGEVNKNLNGQMKLLPNGCLNALPGQSGTITANLKLPKNDKYDLCWSDGATFMQFGILNDSNVLISIPGLDHGWRDHNRWHRFDGLDDAVLSWRTVKLVVPDGSPQQIKLDLKIGPKAK